MLKQLLRLTDKYLPATTAHAHCDGPCGVYDPAAARIHAEAVLSLTKKINTLDLSDSNAQHTFVRYTAIKEQEAEKAKKEIIILWTDYFKPHHLDDYPRLHEVFWKAAKLCSSCKTEISETHAGELLDAIQEIHDIFWATKKREVSWTLAVG